MPVSHGLSKIPEYAILSAMISRCTNPKCPAYPDYGGRGIRICKRWNKRSKIQNFLDDMGYRPSPYHEIDRIDNDKGYFPKNCRWVSLKKNRNNRSDNVRITYKGVTRTQQEWSEHTGIAWGALEYRRAAGWSVHKMLTTPTEPMVTLITYKGRTQSKKEWAEELGINYVTLCSRFDRGFSLKECFTVGKLSPRKRK